MKTTNVNLTDNQMQWLRDEAARIGISMSELLRRIIDAYLNALDR
jgi:hypothetical protein